MDAGSVSSIEIIVFLTDEIIPFSASIVKRINSSEVFTDNTRKSVSVTIPES